VDDENPDVKNNCIGITHITALTPNPVFDSKKWDHQYNNPDNPPIKSVCHDGLCTDTRALDNCPAQFVTLPSGRKVWFTGTFTQDGTDGPSSYNFVNDGADHDAAVAALQKACPVAIHQE
jgi:hypothetical protein